MQRKEKIRSPKNFLKRKEKQINEIIKKISKIKREKNFVNKQKNLASFWFLGLKLAFKRVNILSLKLYCYIMFFFFELEKLLPKILIIFGNEYCKSYWGDKICFFKYYFVKINSSLCMYSTQ